MLFRNVIIIIMENLLVGMIENGHGGTVRIPGMRIVRSVLKC